MGWLGKRMPWLMGQGEGQCLLPSTTGQDQEPRGTADPASWHPLDTHSVSLPPLSQKGQGSNVTHPLGNLGCEFQALRRDPPEGI